MLQRQPRGERTGGGPGTGAALRVRRKSCVLPNAGPLMKTIRPFVPESTAPAAAGRAKGAMRASRSRGPGARRPNLTWPTARSNARLRRSTRTPLSPTQCERSRLETLTRDELRACGQRSAHCALPRSTSVTLGARDAWTSSEALATWSPEPRFVSNWCRGALAGCRGVSVGCVRFASLAGRWQAASRGLSVGAGRAGAAFGDRARRRVLGMWLGFPARSGSCG